jgi:hypothetical protein
MYLVYGKNNDFTRHQMLRKDIVKWFVNQKRDIGIITSINEIITNTNKFIEIKNSQQNVSWKKIGTDVANFLSPGAC